MKLKAFLFILHLYALSLPAFSQYQELKFTHIGTKDGLSHGNVTDICQDSQGFMWFSTRGGLNRFDGYQFTTYKHNPYDPKSISSNAIAVVFEDRQKKLWLGTVGGGLEMYDRDHDSFLHHKYDETNPYSLSSNYVNTIYQDRQGTIWIGTVGGLNKYDASGKRFITYKHNKADSTSVSSNNVTSIAEDDHGNLWIGTIGGGLNLFDHKKQQFAHYHSSSDKHSIPGNHINTLHYDSKGILWIGTMEEGLTSYDRKNDHFTTYTHQEKNANSLSHNTIVCLEEDKQGNLWIGTGNGGISILSDDRKTFARIRHKHEDNYSLSNNSIYSILMDNMGKIWVGTYSGGINYGDLNGAKFKLVAKSEKGETGLVNDNAMCFYEDTENNFWIGTDGGGLNKYDRNTGKSQYYKHNPEDPHSISSNFVLSVLEDKDHHLWVGTWQGGLNKFDRKTNTFSHYTHTPDDPASMNVRNAWTLLEDSKDNFWICTIFGGLNLMDRKHETFTHYMHDDAVPGSLSLNNLHHILEDSKKNLWIGTDGGGLERFNPETRNFTHYSSSDHDARSLSNNNVHYLFEDSRGNLWIGTNGGLNLYDSINNSFTLYLQKDGLPDDAIQGILEDDKGFLWLSTNKGISRFDPVHETFTNYDIGDGLQGNDFLHGSCYKTKDGKMYFGGPNGFNVFHPDSIRTSSFIPPVVITDFQISNKSVGIAEKGSPLRQQISQTEELTLSYEHSVFTFEFSALNYFHPEKNQYAYKMEGFEDEWNYVGIKRSATYTNLDPGTYTFRVKASNNDGVWNEKGTSIRIIITPPFWHTWWFRLLVLCLVTGSAFTFYTRRVRCEKNQKAALEQQVRERTTDLLQVNHDINEQKEEMMAQTEVLGALIQELEDQKEEMQIQAEMLETFNRDLQEQKEDILAASEEADRARHEAEQANKAKSTFLATMSHEIRTPMNGVISMSNLLNETTLTDEQQQYTHIIKTSGEALLTVINDILDFSKIESDMIELEHQPFYLTQCLEEVADLFAVKAAEKQLDLLLLTDPRIPETVIGDSLRLRQVLINLIGNAFKFTSQGEVFLQVELQKSAGQQLQLCFKVSDSGIGIPEDKLSRLFKPFSQVDSSTTRKYGGTGLGLVISKRLIELMGGRISVESKAGKGTTFSFTIQIDINAPAKPVLLHQDLQGKKVLVVDNNLTALSVYKTLLEQLGLSATLAYSAQQALDTVQEKADFDLIITDHLMPAMDGVQLAQAIRQKHTDLPVMLLHPIGDEIAKKQGDLFAATLTKPVKMQQLRQRIQQLFQPVQTSAADTHQQVQPPKPMAGDFAGQYPLRILMAEDYKANQMVLNMLLSKLGYARPALAVNGAEAVAMCTKQPFDVILMDVQMPEMDGLEATTLIRQSLSQQPVIIGITANAMKEDKDACLQAGMDDYISKPIQADLLKQALIRAASKVQPLKA